MISVYAKNLTKKFGDFTAADSLNFEVSSGEIFGFLGPNGAGKSTTIRMLCGILKPTSGEGSVLGHDILNDQEEIKKSIGYMSQKFSLYDDLTVTENLEYFGTLYGLKNKELASSIKSAVKQADLTSSADKTVKNLPAGIKQRLALAASTIHDPDILFLDEPTSGVDPATRRNFWEIIYGFAEKGKTVFVTTHYMDEAEHCGRIALIIAGKIIALDSPANLKKDFSFDIFSVSVEGDFIAEFEKISRISEINEAAIFGNKIHLLLEKTGAGNKGIEKLIKSVTKAKFEIEKVSPTLEDIFVVNAKKYLV